MGIREVQEPCVTSCVLDTGHAACMGIPWAGHHSGRCCYHPAVLCCVHPWGDSSVTVCCVQEQRIQNANTVSTIAGGPKAGVCAFTRSSCLKLPTA